MIEERGGNLYISVKDPQRFQPGSFCVQGWGRGRKVRGILKATGRYATQSIALPLSEARLVHSHGKKVVETRSKAVSELLFLIRRTYKVRMRIQLIQ